MRVAILTPVRLLGEVIAAALNARDSETCVEIFRDLDGLRQASAGRSPPHIVVVDTILPVALDSIRAFHASFPGLPLLALGLREREAEVVAHGSAGFACYLAREEGLDALCANVDDALAGRMRCSPEIASAMMRCLFDHGASDDMAGLPPLTTRENHVAGLVSNGMSNKEIARELILSESTVKHHVHSILGKCRLSTRMQLMRRMRRSLWPRDRSTGSPG